MGQRPVHSTPNVYQFSQPQYNIIEYSNAGSTVIQNRARNNDNISNISSFRQYQFDRLCGLCILGVRVHYRSNFDYYYLQTIQRIRIQKDLSSCDKSSI